MLLSVTDGWGLRWHTWNSCRPDAAVVQTTAVTRAVCYNTRTGLHVFEKMLSVAKSCALAWCIQR